MAGQPTDLAGRSEPTRSERLERIADVVARCPEVAAAWVFGSVARGEAHADSDLDMALLLRPSTSAHGAPDLDTLVLELEPCSPSGRVDLLILGSQGPVITHRILREGILVRDAAPELRIDFEGNAVAAYLDWKPTHEIAMRTSLSGLAKRFRGAGK
jgi:predicted nucleotidyltransferase